MVIIIVDIEDQQCIKFEFSIEISLRKYFTLLRYFSKPISDATEIELNYTLFFKRIGGRKSFLWDR